MKKQTQEKFKTMIGGQALIEGIMMRGPEKQSVVVRAKGELVTKLENVKAVRSKKEFLGLPMIRGVVNFGASLIQGVKALMYSAEVSADEDTDETQTPSKLDQWLEKKLGTEKFMRALIAFAVVIGLGFSIALFFVLPILLGNLFQRLTACDVVVQHLFEGFLRIVIFLLYMLLVSRLKDMKRVFSYHGAEHKSIRCYEAKLPLTVENVRQQTRLHPRCGTSFLFVVMLLSILLFTVASYALNAWIPGLAVLQAGNKLLYNLLMLGVKILLLLPLVVSVSYEINRFVGRHNNAFTRALTAPGMWLQYLTTNEPDDSMIEVAIEALTLVIPDKEGKDKW